MNTKTVAVRFLIGILFMGLCLLIYGTSVVGADLEPNDVTEIKQSVSSLVSDSMEAKQNAIEVLNNYGASAIPLLVDLMQSNQGENVFIGYELVIYAEQLGDSGLPIIAQGLRDANLNARNRAARAAYKLGPQAASIVDDVNQLVANINEDSVVRSQAVDALGAIGIVNSEIKRALALALAANDPMIVWKTNQAVTALDISFDDLISTLFDELVGKRNIYGIITAISDNLHKASNPMGLLQTAFTQPTEALQSNLWLLISGLYSGIAKTSYTQDLVELLVRVAKTTSGTMKEQAIYTLGEIAEYGQTVITELLAMAEDPEVTAEDFLWLALALEKTDPSQPKVIEFFTDTLINENTSKEVKLAAARYLEKSSMAGLASISLFNYLETFDEQLLWRLSPVYYIAAKNNATVIEYLQNFTDEQQSFLLQRFSNNLLSALGEKPNQGQDMVAAANLVSKTPAFPGAEGYGRYTVGGRGGDVYIVTNLNDNGAGSLRAAVEASGPRTVVFAVSGNIMLQSPLDINNPYITIAGQTAPGEGITVAGAPVNIKADQVIIRYIRFRLGDYHNYEADAIGGRNISDVILDHISASWSTDETVSLYLTENVTLQWSFITESLRGSLHAKGNHGYGGIWSDYASYHHNFLAHHSSRNPRIGGQPDRAVDLRNNVIYNWGFNSTYGGEGALVNLIANYYKPGPGTGTGRVNHRIVEISDGGKWYVADNFVYGYPDISADNWAGGVQPRLDKIEDVKHDTEFPVPFVTTHLATEAYELVLANAGATLPARDSIDRRIVEEARSGTATYGGLVSGLDSGIIDSQNDVGGLPFLRSFSAPLDSDADGIPDWWAIKHGFSPEGGLDHAADTDGDGYTNLEEYLNGTNPFKIDNEELISQLVPQLIASDNQVRINAERTLENLHEAAIPAFEQVLYNQDRDTGVLRGVVARFLSKFESPRAIPGLLFVLENDDDAFVRANAIMSLAKLGIPEPVVITALAKGLYDPEENVKVAAADALGSFGTVASDYGIDLLLLSSSSNARFAWACRMAASKVAPEIMSLHEDIIEQLINRLPTQQWQDLAITTLARNAAKALPPIKELAFDPKAKLALRVPAIKVLATIEAFDEETVDKLVTLVLEDKETMLIKIAAIKVLEHVDTSKYPSLAGQITQIVANNPLKHYVYNDQIAIQIENFATENRQNVLVRAVIGFPAEYNIRSDSDFALQDPNGNLLYFEIKPLAFWNSETKKIRTAEITFYPDLKPQERTIYQVNLIDNQHKIEKPGSIDSTGQVRVSIPEQAMEYISTSRLENEEGWMMQLVVAPDGSGNFTTVQAAIDGIPGFNRKRVIVYIKEGVYYEKLIIPSDKAMVTFIGEDKDSTILDFNETPYVQYSPDSMYQVSSASFTALSDNFTAENITFSNSAPVGTGQALAVNLEGDRMVFSNCNFVSHQDTIFANTEGRLYFNDCHIEGDVDFIYGPATAIFENCDIVNVRKTGGYVTAASTPEEKEFGLVFINSRIIGDVNPGTVWLGRPWRPYGHTAYINCYMSEVVQPTGWHNWGKISNEATARYEEYNSCGPGANPDGRVSWANQLTDEPASRYTVENILKGNDGWNPKR